MDTASELGEFYNEWKSKGGFNPCFSGYCFWIMESIFVNQLSRGFNPCFSGYCFWIIQKNKNNGDAILVSILVLVDTASESKITQKVKLWKR